MRDTDPAFVRDLSDSRVEALIETMFLAATADGELSPEERSQFKQSVEQHTGRVVTGEKLDLLIDQAKSALSASSREARLATIRERLTDPDARRLALALAIRVTAVDGIVRTSERELIMETAQALEIDGNTAADLVREITTQSA